MKKIFSLFIMLVLSLTLIACSGNNKGKTYTVTFDSDGGSLVEKMEVKNGYKIDEPTSPTKEGYIFSHWQDGDSKWRFEIDIVTKDVTLKAIWILKSEKPSLIKMREVAFSNQVEWKMLDASDKDFTISIKGENETEYQVIEGEIIVEQGEMDTVTFNPTTNVLGGLYNVKIEVLDNIVESDLLLFQGLGLENNPYLVSKVLDVNTLLENSEYHNKHFLQNNDIESSILEMIEINNSKQIEFNGVYDGNNKNLSFTGNGGLFHKILKNAVVKNVVLTNGTKVTAQSTNLYPVGAIANINEGLITNVKVSAMVENGAEQGQLESFNEVILTENSGAGAIVGINKQTGVIKEVLVTGSGAVKAGRGIGGVSAFNHGLIERAQVTATLPAGNQANSGKSSNTYSYAGGISGYNFGTINESYVSGRVFAQSAYAEAGKGNENKNVAFGGITGYNAGTIKSSSFARDLSSKEFISKTRSEELGDSANNLGVASIHGDIYVGGISGINKGEITDVYVGGALIGGRDYVGGITGKSLSGSTIKNSYVFSEIAIKDDGGVKIKAANSKTTLTTYNIAPEGGFEVSSTFYKPLYNNVSKTNWEAGDSVLPSLPLFDETDLNIVGDKFSSSGVLKWQTGSITLFNILEDEVTISFGSDYEIEFELNPSNAIDKFITWTSSNLEVVEIIGEGVIKGVGAGTATITGTTRDGGLTDTIIINVNDYIKVTDVTVTSNIDLPTANNASDRPFIDLDSIAEFFVEFAPENAEFKDFSIRISNSRAEIVEGTLNQVKFIKTGKVSIYIDFSDKSLDSLEYRFEVK